MGVRVLLKSGRAELVHEGVRWERDVVTGDWYILDRSHKNVAHFASDQVEGCKKTGGPLEGDKEGRAL